jgi:hypothetical protein
LSEVPYRTNESFTPNYRRCLCFALGRYRFIFSNRA